MSRSGLRVGAAKVEISPTPDCFPFSGWESFGYEGVREGEGLHARAIAIDNGEKTFLFEAFELSGPPSPTELVGLLQKETGLAAENIMITGTHNHSAPFVIGDMPMPMRFDPDPKMLKFKEIVMKGAVKAAKNALASLRPATYGFGEGKSYINVNRDQHFDDGHWMQGMNYEGCSDKTLAVIKFTDAEGKLIAAILNYAMHSTTSFCSVDIDGKQKVTCDAPGIACQFVEEYYGNDAVVMWQSGAAGNQNPYYIGIKQVFNSKGAMSEVSRIPGAAYEQGKVFGQQHGMDAIRALESISASRKQMKITTVDKLLYFPGQKFPEGIDRGYHRLMVDNLLVWAGRVKSIEEVPEKMDVEMISADEKVPAKAQLVILGDIAIFGLAAELYNEIAVLCKEASPFKHTMITTHIGQPSAGYILDDASKGHKVFQSFGQVREGESNAIVVNGMLEMFDEALAD
jgi:hypothetical protein